MGCTIKAEFGTKSSTALSYNLLDALSDSCIGNCLMDKLIALNGTEVGCGAVGGSSSSNNISPLDLINIRRVAWDVEDKPAAPRVRVDADLLELLTATILERLK